MAVARQDRRMTNLTYQQVTGASRATAKRDLEDLVAQGLLVPKGAGRGSYYEVPRKRPSNGSIGPSKGKPGNGP